MGWVRGGPSRNFVGRGSAAGESGSGCSHSLTLIKLPVWFQLQ